MLLAMTAHAAAVTYPPTTCPSGVGAVFPTTLTNGQPADADQVMSNFNWLQQCGYFPNKVGIGTASPGSSLHIQAPAGQDAVIRVYGDDTQWQALNLGSSQTDRWTLAHSTGNEFILFEEHSGDGGGAGAGRITVLQGGNVGIGTSAPEAKLDVAGEVKVGSTGVGCSAANEGSQRYNSTSKIMEFCNGTSWNPVGGGSFPGNYCVFTSSSSCPSGWIQRAFGGFIWAYGTSCPFLYGSDYNGGWGWCHPYVCCNF